MISKISEHLDRLSKRVRILLTAAALIPAFLLYINGIDRNPPGFYVDEAATSYNAYTIYLKGQGDLGHSMPLYFPVFPLGPPFDYLGYSEPTQIYVLAALNYIFPPSVTLSRGLSATAMFLAALLLGWLAMRISASRAAGFIVAVTALLTPWLFEMGRLAFAASLYPLVVTILLVFLYRASRKEVWSIPDVVLIALSLALTTYTYAIGRLLGPILALGLLLFINSRRQLLRVILTWTAYGIALVPMLIFHLRNPQALTGRLNMTVGYISADKSYGQIFAEFFGHYLANISPTQLLFVGDLNLRHHISDTAPVFAVTLLLAIFGAAFVFLKYRRDRWWLYILFGIVVCIIPASLTKDDFHSLRLSAFPIFLLILTIPVLRWLVSKPAIEASDGKDVAKSRIPQLVRSAAVVLVLVLTLIQAVSFQFRFDKIGPTRLGYFDANFPAVFAAAIERPERPIYLVDQYHYHAFWQAAVQGIDASNFVRLAPMQRPPADSLVLSGEERCSDCELFVKDIPFVVYKTRSGPRPLAPGPTSQANNDTAVVRPRGIAADASGNYYIADTANARIAKFDAAGMFAASFGSRGEGEGQFLEPHGIAVDRTGRIYVTDSLNHKLLRFKSDGTFEKEWRGPDSGFYGPRDIEIDTTGKVYIVDQGRTRIVRFDPATEAFSVFGSAGSGEGQLSDPSGIAIGGGSIFVTDTGNGRVQVFDNEGRYLRQWPVLQWEKDVQFFPNVALDELSGNVLVTSGKSNEVLEYAANGGFLRTLSIDAGFAFENPSALVISDTKRQRLLLVLNTKNGNVTRVDMGTKRVN